MAHEHRGEEARAQVPSPSMLVRSARAKSSSSHRRITRLTFPALSKVHVNAHPLEQSIRSGKVFCSVAPVARSSKSAMRAKAEDVATIRALARAVVVMSTAG
eukprot:scaffold289752_cov31-Tisochrysis_lutea.AAC.2